MKNSKSLKVLLACLGVLLIILGAIRLINPIAFFQNSGLLLDNSVGMLSEARGTGGVVLGFGLVIFSGAFVRQLAFTSTLSAVILFLGFGIARLISVGFDGIPGQEIIQGIVFEFVLGTLALIALIKFRVSEVEL